MALLFLLCAVAKKILKSHQKKNAITNWLLQTAPFKCPVEGCPYESKVRHNLTVHYGVTHRNVFKFFNSMMGAGSGRELESHAPCARPAPKPSGGGRARGSRGGAASMEACLVCEEMVSKETMVFHLAHKHFHNKEKEVKLDADRAKVVVHSVTDVVSASARLTQGCQV